MMALDWLPVLAAAAGVALALGVASVRVPVLRPTALSVVLAGALQHAGYSLVLLGPSQALQGVRLAAVAGTLQAAALYWFATSLLAWLGPSEQTVSVRTAGASLLVLPPLVGAWLLPSTFERPVAAGSQAVLGGLGQALLVAWVFLLLFALARVEQLWRRGRDPLRYQLKFLLLAFVGMGAVQVYIISLVLLEGAWHPELGVAHSAVTLLWFGLAGVGVFRLHKGVERVPLAPIGSGYGSLSLVVVATYLLVLGTAVELLPGHSRSSHFVMLVALVSAAALWLAVVFTSRYVRTRLGRFLALTFKRSKHDYHKKWLEVSELFRGVGTSDEILDRLLEWLAGSFGARRLSIWLRLEADQRFHRVRSVNLESSSGPLAAEHPLVRALERAENVVNVDPSEHQGDAFVASSELKLLVPLRDTSELLGLVLLSDDGSLKPYEQDDFDLLQAACTHASVLISHARLAERHRADAQMRALGEFSMFCIHDLKNLAGRLSLVAQNAKRFHDNPDFQASALRTVVTTVDRMTGLIQKLSSRAAPEWQADTEPASTDLFEVLGEACPVLKAGVRLSLPSPPAQRPLVALHKETVVQLLLNVITNAEQSLAEEGEVTVGFLALGSEHLVTVCDTGCGIAPSALATLFQPFRTTKSSGLGVGLYQCKRTLEAAGGRLLVESELGIGTTVKMYLPRAVSFQEEAAG